MWAQTNPAPFLSDQVSENMDSAVSSRLALIFCFSTSVVYADGAIDFARDVAPIFEQHCVRCHSSLSSKGDLSLETFADLKDNEYVVAGEAEDSHLLQVLTGNQPQMPKAGRPLSPKEVDTIRRWINRGAEWPDDVFVREKSKADSSWWSLQPLSAENLQHTSDTTVDQFVQSKLSELGLQPAAEADRRTLVRRLYIDMIGLPPSPEVVATFVADPDPRAYENLVDQLLASPRFGERWARHWLDIAHYADTHGFERDKRRDNAWHYRDYVIRAFNDDKPFDHFLREQIAGDVIAPDDADAIVATGFLAAGPWDFVGQEETKSPELRRAARALDLDDMVTQVMTATVGMTVNCARCHDHKLDPILQREYYQLTAVFAGLKRADRDVSQQARKDHAAKKQTLENAISEVQVQIGQLEGKAIDLADIVGGGNGFGSGKKGLGIDARTGKTQERPFGDLGNVKPGDFRKCEHRFIDGVFVPANQRTQITSTELSANDLPANSGKAWDMIRNGPVSSQFSTKLGATDFNTAGHSMIGLHANAGITFDLQAIRSGWSDDDADEAAAFRFSTTAGYGGRTEEPSAEYYVLLDGELKASRKIGRNDADAIAFDILRAAKFLTLISTDGGDGYSHDQISFGDPRLARVVASHHTVERQQQLADLQQRQKQLAEELKQLGEPPVFFGVVAEPPPEVNVLVRGNPETPTVEVVQPGTLGWKKADVTFGDQQMDEGQRRLALANWITDEQNPLTARVIVNRLWHWHFGQGIVDTPSDFGYGGGQPSHPKLLDWLAAELIRSQWSLKHIHRLIVTSHAYRQSSEHSKRAAAIDSDNRLLWRMNVRRLEAEAVRDSVLAVTGKLNAEMFGPGYRDFDYQEAYAPIYTYKTANSPDLWRRSVYRFVVRTTPQQFLATLDCADPANFTPKRNVTTTALQSLAMFNNDFMLKQSEYFAERLQRDAKTLEQQIDRAFQLAFSRPATEDERTAAGRLVNDQGLPHLCRVLLNANEFVYVD